MYVFVTSCVCCPRHLVPYLVKMVDNAKEITLKTLRKACCPKSLSNILCDLGYVKGSLPTIESDYAVRFYRSRFKGYPCVFIVHSAIEYIFMEENINI